MSVKLKPLNQQVLLITGAANLVGMATIRLALDQGAKIFMVDDNEEELQKIQTEMRRRNLPTAYAVANTSETDQLQAACDQCLSTFGTIDCWINNAGSSLYTAYAETDESETRLLFENNFWGLVNGSKVAGAVLRKSGGSLINVASDPAEASPSLQSLYVALRMAAKSYTQTYSKQLALEKALVKVYFVSSPSVDIPLKILKKSVGESLFIYGNFLKKKAPPIAEIPKMNLIGGLTDFIKRKRA